MSSICPANWFTAAQTGHLAFLAENRLYQGKLNKDGLTALALAITSGQHEAAMYLAKHEAKVRLQHRRTALMFAAMHNWVELLPLLEETCRWQDENGYTALMHAVMAGNAPDAAAWLVPHEAGMRSFICEATTDDFDLLNRQMESLQYVTPHHTFEDNLLDAGTALTQDKTALHMAALRGDLAMCRLLLPHEFLIPDASGEYFTMLLSKLDRDTAALFCPLILKQIDMLRPIIGKRSTTTGKTALLYAIAEENVPLVGLFADYELRLGIVGHKSFVSPNNTTYLSESAETIARRTYTDFTAFHYAALARDPEVLRVLLESAKRLNLAALVEEKDDMERNALHIAAYGLNSSHARMLLAFAEENGVSLDIYDKQHYTPIDYAITSYLFAPHCAQCRAAATKRKSRILCSEELDMRDTHALKDRLSSIISIILPVYRGRRDASAEYLDLMERHLLLSVSHYNYISTSILSKNCEQKQLGKALLSAAELCFNEAVQDLIDGVYNANSYSMSAMMLMATYASSPFKLLFSRYAKSQNDHGETALMLACGARCFENALIALDDEKTMRTKDNKTALMYLASLSEETYGGEQQGLYKELSRRLIEAEHGAVNTSGCTALMHAVKANNLGLFNDLLEWEYGFVSKNEMSALMLAAQHGNAKMVEALLTYERSSPQYAKGEGTCLESQHLTSSKVSALMLAAMQPNNARVCQLLVPFQAGIQDKTGSTALMIAIESGSPENASALVPYEHSKVDKRGYTALMRAIEKDQASSITGLIEYERGKGLDKETGQTALMLVVRSSKISVANKMQYIKQLVGKEGGVQDRDGKTALQHALMLGNGEAGQLAALLTKTDGGKQMSDGTSALMLAINRGLYDVALLLVNAEAKMVTTTGYTALMCLCSGEDASRFPEQKRTVYNNLLQKLIKEEAGLKNSEGFTALMLAVTHRNAYIVGELIPYEALARNAQGETALMLAAKHNMVDIIRLLVAHEGGICNNEGDNALIYACMAGLVNAAVALTACRAEVDVTPNTGLTPLMIAADRGLYPVVLCLKDMCPSILCEKGKYAGCSTLGLAIKGGHNKVARLLFEEAYLGMGTPHGAIEMCIQYTNDTMLLELLEYYRQCTNKDKLASSPCYDQEARIDVCVDSLRDAFMYALAIDNVQIMHLATEILGQKIDNIESECIPDNMGPGARFYVLLMRADEGYVLSKLQKRWRWMLSALYQAAENSTLALLLVDRLMAVFFDGCAEDAIVELVHALRELDADSCCICMDEDAQIVLFPCRHMIACSSCSRGLARCPYCRKDIKSTMEPRFAHVLEETRERCACM